MQYMKGFGVFAISLAVLWMFALCGDVLAQGKGQKKDKKKNEQVKEKEKEQKTDRVEDYIEENAEGAAKVKHAKKVKYKPKGMTDTDMMEWTDGNPPGWSRGRKTGWGGAGAPPGQMKKQGVPVHEQSKDREMIRIYPPESEDWDTKKKEDWDIRVERTKTRVLERMKTRGGMTEEDEESAAISIDGAARRGVPLEQVETTVDKAVNKGLRGPDLEKITRAMTYGTDKDTDYDKLGRFVNARIDDGETGDDIAVSVYKEIDDGTMAKKRPWYNRWFNR
jgi:hypothetical protein